MSTDVALGEIVYPSSDGKPMSESMRQYNEIVYVKGNLDIVVGTRGVVAGDNLVYPVEGQPRICIGPDVYVAIGRPLGLRASYQVWREGGIFPQVIFEIMSPSNTPDQMDDKLEFYNEHGAEEYYVYDPERIILTGYMRGTSELEPIPQMHNWVSTLLGVRFDMSGEEWAIYRPDGTRFETVREMYDRAQNATEESKSAKRRADTAQRRADASMKRADATQKVAEAAQDLAETESQRANDLETENARLRELLKAAGIAPPH